LTYLATAALVLLSLIGGFVAIRGSMHLLEPENPAVVIPAIDDTPGRVLPSGITADNVLLRATLDRAPAEGTPRIALQRITLQPGASQSVGAQSDTGVGSAVFTVESGQITVTADAPVLLTRGGPNAGAATSAIPAGTDVAVDVGDQLFAPDGVTLRRRNDGGAPATVLDFSVNSAGDSLTSMSLPPGVTSSAGFPFTLPATFPAVPAEATVHRMTLAPGAELPVRDLPGLELVYVETGNLDLIYAKSETPETLEQFITIRAGNGTEAFGRTPDRAVLVNRGSEPLVILAASIVPTGAGASTPQAPVSDGWGTGDKVP
jgi:quercetin dioxygenase-like cupin family protein